MANGGISFEETSDMEEQTALATKGMTARYLIEQAAGNRAATATAGQGDAITAEAVRMAIEEAGRSFMQSLDGLEPHQLGMYYDTVTNSLGDRSPEEQQARFSEIYADSSAEDVASVSTAYSSLLQGVAEMNAKIEAQANAATPVETPAVPDNIESEQQARAIIEDIARSRIAAEAAGMSPEDQAAIAEQAAQRAAETFAASLETLDDNQRQQAIDYVIGLPEKIDTPNEFHHSRLYEDMLSDEEPSADQEAVYDSLSSVVSEIGSVSGEIEAGNYEITPQQLDTETPEQAPVTDAPTAQAEETDTSPVEPERVDNLYDPLDTSGEQPPEGKTAIYNIQSGDSLSQIVSCFYGNDELFHDTDSIRAVSEIVAKANNLPNIHSIRAEDDLVLPPAEKIELAMQNHEVDPSQWYTPENINVASNECTTTCTPGTISYTDSTMKI